MVYSSRTIAAIIAISASRSLVLAFSSSPNSVNVPPSRSPTVLHEATVTSKTASSDLSRRTFLSTVSSASLAVTSIVLPFGQPAHAASQSKESLVNDLNDSLSKINTLPALLESGEWDKARTVLKTPPVNQLWNLGESQNTLVKLAKETGDFELLEMKDELAISLQMTDQYSYDNVFIYFQPGNGKVKTKEPLEMANKAISQLKEALAVVNSS